MASARRKRGASAPKGGRGKGKDPELLAVGARVRSLRDAAGLTQEGLADAAGMHWTYVGQVERGERNLTYKSILRLARGLEVEPVRLIEDRG